MGKNLNVELEQIEDSVSITNTDPSKSIVLEVGGHVHVVGPGGTSQILNIPDRPIKAKIRFVSLLVDLSPNKGS